MPASPGFPVTQTFRALPEFLGQILKLLHLRRLLPRVWQVALRVGWPAPFDRPGGVGSARCFRSCWAAWCALACLSSFFFIWSICLASSAFCFSSILPPSSASLSFFNSSAAFFKSPRLMALANLSAGPRSMFFNWSSCSLTFSVPPSCCRRSAKSRDRSLIFAIAFSFIGSLFNSLAPLLELLEQLFGILEALLLRLLAPIGKLAANRGGRLLDLLLGGGIVGFRRGSSTTAGAISSATSTARTPGSSGNSRRRGGLTANRPPTSIRSIRATASASKRLARLGLAVGGRQGQRAGDAFLQREAVVEFDGGFQRTGTARRTSKPRRQPTRRPSPRRPRPGFQPKRPELIDGDQHQCRRKRGEPAPGEHVEKPLGDQPPPRPADLLLKGIHGRHPPRRVVAELRLAYILSSPADSIKRRPAAAPDAKRARGSDAAYAVATAGHGFSMSLR